MKKINVLSCFILFAFFHLSHTEMTRHPEKIKGRLVDKTNQLPISNAHVYVVSGEEEALSSTTGSFEITTWQAFPITVTFSHANYHKLSVVYRRGDESPVVRLEKQ